MGRGAWTTAAALLALLLPGTVAAQAPGGEDRIYGRVITASGDVYQGFIRWTDNEASWGDVLNGDKEMPFRNVQEAERLGAVSPRDRERTIEVLGLRITWDEDDAGYPDRMSSGVRFGHIRTLTVLDDEAALIGLKDGTEIELEGGSSDIGESLDYLELQDPDRGRVELRWRDIDVVEFLAAPADEVPEAARIHGTVVDRHGNEYTGYVAWDIDEVFADEVLDGEEDGRDREIPFRSIAAIERDGWSASRVTLTTGEELVLRGSNDVDDDNRGIQVADPGLGLVVVEWEDFESIRFHPPERPDRYDDYDGGLRIYGTVRTEDGEEVTGHIRWDNDEEYTWELLDGTLDDVEFDIEFSRIERIERLSSRTSEVTLRDGRRFELGESNDVDRGNKGLFVELEDGTVTLVRWEDVREVAFAR